MGCEKKNFTIQEKKAIEKGQALEEKVLNEEQRAQRNEFDKRCVEIYASFGQ